MLSATLGEQEQLLQKLEQLAKVHQGISSAEKVVGFPLGRAQTLLFELSVLNEYIDTLISEINGYAVRCGRPRVEIIETKLQ